MPPPEKTQALLADVPQIRAATIADVPAIHDLLETYANKGNLLPRSINEIYRHLRDFFVIELNSKIAAIGALEIFTEDLGEVRSLVVADEYERRGLGRLMVQRIIAEPARSVCAG